jgi:multidrug efflux pump subunit AcrB
MWIWFKPDLLQSFDIAVSDVMNALRTQNVQVASGTLNSAPQPNQRYYEYIVQTQGRLQSPKEFENIIVKAGDDGRIVKLKDVARIELGAQDYVTKGYLGE